MASDSGDSFSPPTGQTVDEIVDRERVRELFTRRERLLDALENREEARLGTDTRGEPIDRLIEQKCRAYTMDLAPLVHTAVKDNLVEKDYWNDYPQIRIEIPPPPREMWAENWMQTPEVRTPQGRITSNPKPIVVSDSGLSVLTEYRSPLSLTWQQRARKGVGQTAWVPVDYDATLPIEVSERVFAAADEFLGAIGLDINIDGGEVDVESTDPF